METYNLFSVANGVILDVYDDNGVLVRTHPIGNPTNIRHTFEGNLFNLKVGDDVYSIPLDQAIQIEGVETDTSNQIQFAKDAIAVFPKANTSPGAGGVTLPITSDNISDFAEAVQDVVGNFLGAGSNVNVTYDDATNSLTVTGTGGTTDPEAVRDAIGAALIGVGGLNVVVNDTGDTIIISQSIASNQEVINASNLAAWGDSLTWGQGAPDATWPNDFSFLSGFTIYNGGIPGETSTTVKNRQLAATDKLGYAAVIWVGRNDISITGPSSVATVKQNVADMVAALGHTKYVIIGITPKTDETTGTTNATAINQYNSDQAVTYGTRFIDIAAFLKTQGTSVNGVLPAAYMSDATHLNAAGYLLVAQQVNTKLSVLQSASTNLVTVSNGTAFNPFSKEQFSIGTGGKYMIGGGQVVYLPNQTTYANSLYIGNGGQNSTASNNFTSGFNAGVALTTGGNNSLSGAFSGFKITTGNQNALNGPYTGFNIVAGRRNTFSGFNAGIGGDLNWCSFFGDNAGGNATTTYGSTAIGRDSYLPTNGTTNFQLGIMEAIYGIGLDGASGVISTGNIGLFVKAPTARLHLPAGAVGVGKAPLKLTSGINLTVPENGVFEFDGSSLFFTVGGVRKTVTLT